MDITKMGIKHKVTPIERLLYYQYLPPPMKGDPQPTSEFDGVEGWQSWEERERAVYEAMMKEKKKHAV